MDLFFVNRNIILILCFDTICKYTCRLYMYLIPLLPSLSLSSRGPEITGPRKVLSLKKREYYLLIIVFHVHVQLYINYPVLFLNITEGTRLRRKVLITITRYIKISWFIIYRQPTLRFRGIDSYLIIFDYVL